MLIKSDENCTVSYLVTFFPAWNFHWSLLLLKLSLLDGKLSTAISLPGILESHKEFTYTILYSRNHHLIHKNMACLTLICTTWFHRGHAGEALSVHRADSRPAPSQWKTSLQSNVVSHWLCANLELALVHTFYGCIKMGYISAGGILPVLQAPNNVFLPDSYPLCGILTSLSRSIVLRLSYVPSLSLLCCM